jgi:hypothetical protein
MKRSRIITRARDLVEPQKENLVDPMGRPSDPSSGVGEVLVAVTARELEKLNVVNSKGEKLGKINDLMIDLKTGCTAYAVLESGGKLFAIPWELFCIDNAWNYEDIYRQRIIFNVSKDKLEKAPGFDKDSWPREPDRKWLQDVYTYYGCHPYWAPEEEANKPQPPSG